MWLIWFMAVAFADCPQSAEQVVWRAVDDVHSAYITLDERGFDLSANAIRDLIPCIDAPLSPEQAARLHRSMGLIAFVSGQVQASRKSWAAARLIEPSWSLPERDYPPGHPLRDIFDSSVIDGEPKKQTLDAASWLVDGEDKSEAPLDRAFLLQALDATGDVSWTGYLWSIVDVPMSFVKAEGVGGVDIRVAILPLLAAKLASQSAQTRAHGALVDTSDSTMAAGVKLDARWLPDLRMGGEVEGVVLGNTDAVLGGGYLVEGSARVLAGVAPTVGRTGRVRVAARAGFAIDQMRMWGFAADQAQIFTVPSLSLGAEVGYLQHPFIVLAGVDTRLASGTVPYHVGGEVSAGWMVQKVLALESTLTTSHEWMTIHNEQSVDVGAMRDTDIRFGIGVGVWR